MTGCPAVPAPCQTRRAVPWIIQVFPVRTLLASLALLAAPSLLGCAADPQHTARTAFDDQLPVEIPSWAAAAPEQASPPAPPRVYRTIELGAVDSDTRPSDPASAPPYGPGTPPVPGQLPAYGYYGYDVGYPGYTGYHEYGAHRGYDSSRTPGGSSQSSWSVVTVPYSTSSSSSSSSPKPGDNWPAVRDYGPSFPFNWANPMR